MIPRNLIFLSAHSHDECFIWQCQVFIVNFRDKGVPMDQIHIVVWYPKTGLNQRWELLRKKYPRVKFFFYKDEDVDLKLYIPQLRPNVLKRYIADNPSDNVFFYHDADIIFNFLPNFTELVKGPVCWQSDTSGYLDYNYLRSKEIEGKIPEHEAIGKLAEIGKVSVDTIMSYKGKTGGAQYIIKGMTKDFWEDVERQVLEIRRAFSFDVPGSFNRKYFPSENAGFQSWCADMWAVNFSLWNRDKVTDVTDELAFSWATDSYETYEKKPIFHNAGATAGNKRLFFKGAWLHRSPLPHVDKIYVSKAFAQHAYVEAMKKAKNG